MNYRADGSGLFRSAGAPGAHQVRSLRGGAARLGRFPARERIFMDHIEYKFSQDSRWNKKKIITFAVIAALSLAVLIFAARGLGTGLRRASVTHLRCTTLQDVTPFGRNLLYYDGTTLFCLNASGKEQWSYTLGSNARFSAGDKYVVAWAGSKLVILSQNGVATYDSQLSETIQFCRAGDKYVALVLGQNISPKLVMKDLQGITVDSETSAYEDKIILDMGFFSGGEYLWTTCLDVYGSVPNIVMNTFKVAQMSTGEVSLGENLVYRILYSGQKLNVVSTRQLRCYDYRGTIDDTGTRLVYGWQLIHADAGRGDAQMLFGRADQTDDMNALTDLRYLSGKNDRRFTLPNTCVGAVISSDRIYAFSEKTLYRADVNGERFSAVNLSVGSGVTSYIGALEGGVVLLASGTDVYAVTLP